MKTIYDLPPEIMHLILHPGHFTIPWFSSYPDPNLKAYIGLRLVSQIFSAIITPHIFKNLRIKSTECSLKRLKTVAESEHLKSLVKTYTYILVKIRPPTRGAYDEYLRLAADPSGLSTPEVIRASKDIAMDGIPIWIAQREFEFSNDLQSLHLAHLTTLPSLRRIYIDAPGWCGLSDMPHDMETPAGGKQWGPVAFRAILSAMYNRTQTPAVSPIEDLSINGISEECMALPPHIVTQAIAAMTPIKHLKLSIRTLRDTAENGTPGWILLIGRLIQSTTSLETLELEVQESVTELHFRSLVTPARSKLVPFRPAPQSTRWANLKKLMLNDLIFNESHILQFITVHKKTLTHLSFDSCRLRSDPEKPKEADSSFELDFSPLPVHANPWLGLFRAVHEHFTPGTAAALTKFYIEDLWFDQPKLKRMHDCEMSQWTRYIGGDLKTEPKETRGLPDCADCQEELDDNRDEDDEGTDESDPGYFFGGHGFGFGFWGEDDDEFEDEDISDMEDNDDDVGDEAMIEAAGLAAEYMLHPELSFYPGDLGGEVV